MTPNSSDKNPFFNFNGQEFSKINKMSREELEKHIGTWVWI